MHYSKFSSCSGKTELVRVNCVVCSVFLSEFPCLEARLKKREVNARMVRGGIVVNL